MRTTSRHPILWDGLAVCLVAVGLSLGGWALTVHSSYASSCGDFSQLSSQRGHARASVSSLARVQSATLSRVSGGGLDVVWQFDQEYPNLGHSVGDLEVDIRPDSRAQNLILVIPTLGNTAWAQMGQNVKVVTAQQRPYEVLVTFSRSQVFGLTGPFLWTAEIDYGVVSGVTSSCPGLGSPSMKAG